MRFNALIATHGRCDLLRRTLQSLAQSPRPEGFEHVWVIENASDEGARQMCAEIATTLPVQYLHFDQAGKSRALNRAVERIKQGFLLFLDDDIRVPTNLFESYAKAARQHGPKHFLGGPVEVDYELRPPDWLIPYLPPSARGWSVTDSKYVMDANAFLGFNYGAFAEDVLAVGGMNESVGPGALKAGTEGNPMGTETDLQFRLFAAGCKPVYLPDVTVHHFVPHERCTPQWVLHRHYRKHMTLALKDIQRDHGPVIAGYPRWMWKRAAALAMKSLLAGFVPDARRRFEMKLPCYEHKGAMHGFRLAMAQRKQASPSAS